MRINTQSRFGWERVVVDLFWIFYYTNLSVISAAKLPNVELKLIKSFHLIEFHLTNSLWWRWGWKKIANKREINAWNITQIARSNAHDNLCMQRTLSVTLNGIVFFSASSECHVRPCDWNIHAAFSCYFSQKLAFEHCKIELNVFTTAQKCEICTSSLPSIFVVSMNLKNWISIKMGTNRIIFTPYEILLWQKFDWKLRLRISENGIQGFFSCYNYYCYWKTQLFLNLWMHRKKW